MSRIQMKSAALFRPNTGAQWNNTLVLLKPIPPYRHTLAANLSVYQMEFFKGGGSIVTVWNGAIENKDADIRHWVG